MNKRVGATKTTLRDTYKSVEERGGYVEELHVQIKGEECILYLLSLFYDISRGRTIGGIGPNPLSHQDIMSWSQMHGVRLTSFELTAIRELDELYISETYRK